VPENKAQRAKK